MRAPELAATPWRHGRLDGRPGRPRLLFGRMYEDPAIERACLPPCGRVLAVASAGDVALALARSGLQVTAVDVNPVQVAYVRARLDGAPARNGQAEHLLTAARTVLRAAGWRAARLDRFCQLDDPAAQLLAWRRELAGPAVRRLAAVATRSPLPRAVFGAAFERVAPGDFGLALLRRLERGFGRHPNRRNPWAHLLLRGRWPAPEPAPPAPGSLRLVCAELAAYLESVPPGCYHGFALSNVLDGPGPAYRARLLRAVRRAGAPGAVVVLRTLGEPAAPVAAAWAARDRSLIWGGITVATAEGAR
jgi:Protein of unknown function (DUF3419)